MRNAYRKHQYLNKRTCTSPSHSLMVIVPKSKQSSQVPRTRKTGKNEKAITVHRIFWIRTMLNYHNWSSKQCS